MLCLTRYLSRGDDHAVTRLVLEDGRVIVVRLLEVEQGRARLGFECDRAIAIERGEYRQPPPASGQGREGVAT